MILSGHTFSNEPGVYIEEKVRWDDSRISPLLTHSCRSVCAWRTVSTLTRMVSPYTSRKVSAARPLVPGVRDACSDIWIASCQLVLVRNISIQYSMTGFLLSSGLEFFEIISLRGNFTRLQPVRSGKAARPEVLGVYIENVASAEMSASLPACSARSTCLRPP